MFSQKTDVLPNQAVLAISQKSVTLKFYIKITEIHVLTHILKSASICSDTAMWMLSKTLYEGSRLYKGSF